MAYQWLVDTQLPDGSWFNYYLTTGIEDARLDTNVCAYLATGAWHRYVSTGEIDGLENRCGPPSRPVSTSCSGGSDSTVPSIGRSTRRGFSRSTPSSPGRRRSTTASGAPSPVPSGSATNDRTGSWPPAGWPTRSPTSQKRSPPRWSSPWTGITRCSPARSPARPPDAGSMGPGTLFVMDGRGVRCVSTGEWVTAAETAECVLALDALGMDDLALRLLTWVQALRNEDGSYWTGMVYPEEATFPPLERSSYTAGAMVLAADALSRTTPASGIFRGEGLPSHLDLTEPAPDAPVEPALGAPGPPGTV